VIARAHHLHDDRLFDCYVAARTGESPDPPSTDHLLTCDACAARYVELTAFMDGVRAEGDAEADSVFTAERLWNQQQQIMRRLEHVGRAARIISFPGRVGRHVPGPPASHRAGSPPPPRLACLSASPSAECSSTPAPGRRSRRR